MIWKAAGCEGPTDEAKWQMCYSADQGGWFFINQAPGDLRFIRADGNLVTVNLQTWNGPWERWAIDDASTHTVKSV